MKNYKDYLDEGIYDIRNGDFNAAVEKIDQALEIKRDWEIPYFYRAVAHQALKNFDDALLDYTKAIQINPKMTDAYYNRAYINLTRTDINAKDFSKIINDLEKALELDPNFIDALFAMAATQKKLENYHKSLEYLERLLQIEPEAINARALKKLILQKYII